MKKILLILLTAALVFFTAGFSAVSARAESGEGEKAAQTETESVSTSDSASDSVDGSETITITKDELKQLIDDALTENQKNIIKLISEKLSAWTGLDFTAIYLIIAGAAVVLIAIIVFIVKYVRTKTRLKATQSAYDLEKKIAERNSKILENLSNDGIFKLVLEAMKEGGDDLVVKLAQALKLDEQTISKLLTAMELAEEREQKIMLALKAIAKDAGKTEIVNALSEAPTKTAVENLTLENEKLKIALGDEKVREILAK